MMLGPFPGNSFEFMDHFHTLALYGPPSRSSHEDVLEAFKYIQMVCRVVRNLKQGNLPSMFLLSYYFHRLLLGPES